MDADIQMDFAQSAAPIDPIRVQNSDILVPPHVSSYLSPPSDMSSPPYYSTFSYSTLYNLLKGAETSPEDIRRALEEYAFRSIIEGRRVREWCFDLSRIINKLGNTSLLHSILSTPALSILFPLVDLPISGPAVSPRFATPVSLLSAEDLAKITQKQLIDMLSGLSREGSVLKGKAPGLREQVMEICLEYIGRRWRHGLERKEGDLAEGVGKKLAEVELELQQQGYPEVVRCVILPILVEVRFSLGLVTASQLANRLNMVVIGNAPHRNEDLDQTSLIENWLTIRFRAGSEPQRLTNELLFIRNQIHHQQHKDELDAVLASFGLEGQGEGLGEDSILGSLIIDTPSHLSFIEEGLAATKTCKMKSPALRSKVSLRKTLPLPGPSRWWSSKRRGSSSPDLVKFDPNRRPSLPNTSLHSPIMKHPSPSYTTQASSASSTSTDSVTTRGSANDTATTAQPSDVLATMMTFNTPEDMRLILLDHLFGLRYRLSADAKRDWYLGDGRHQALETISFLEAKLVGKRDVMGMKMVFDDLRKIFHLPVSTPVPSSFRPKHRAVNDLKESETTRRFADFSASVEVLPSTSLAQSRRSLSTGYSESGYSFDLDQYILDISPITRKTEVGATETPSSLVHGNPDRKSLGAKSTFTLNSLLTDVTPRSQSPNSAPRSGVSPFTIREATRAWPVESIGTRVRLPRRPASIGSVDELRGASSVGIDSQVTPRAHEDPVDAYTRLPPRLYPDTSPWVLDSTQLQELHHGDAPGDSSSDTPQQDTHRHCIVLDDADAPRLHCAQKPLPDIPNTCSSTIPSGLTLSEIIGLFDTSQCAVTPKMDLTIHKVEIVLSHLRPQYGDRDGHQRVRWMIGELRALLRSEEYDALFQPYLQTLDRPPDHAPIGPRPVLGRSTTCPNVLPSDGFHIDPSRPIGAPRTSGPMKAGTEARRPNRIRAMSRLSDSSLISMMSTNTFGTPGTF